MTFYDGDAKLSISPLVGAAGDEVALPAYNAATKPGYSIGAWKIGDEYYAPNLKYSLTAANVNATAVWVSIKLRKRGTGADADTDVNAIGSLYLLSSEDGYDAHIEPTNGATGEWLFAPKPNVAYRVGCTMRTTDPDKFWAFSGVTDTQGNAVAEIAFGQTLGNIVLYANFTRKTQSSVTTDTRAEVDSIRPDEMVATLEITIPSAPDVVAPGQTPPYDYGTYIVGQSITATARYPDGMIGWKLVNAVLEIGGVSSTPISNYIDGDNINIPASNFTDSMRIVGILGRVDCKVSANADGPSSVAVSGVSVRKWSEAEQDWVPANTAKYGETVRVYAEVDAENGYNFDGIHANGEIVEYTYLDDDHTDPVVIDYSGQLPYSETYTEGGVTKTRHYINYRVQGETAFVVKAKVTVRLCIGHWDVSGETWTDGPCKIVVNYEGETIESANIQFDVVLGNTFDYSVRVLDGWHFDAWFNGTEDEKPESFDNPVDLPVSDPAFAPTSPIEVIARVTDSVVDHFSAIVFVNNDTPDDPIRIQADPSNVSSFPAQDYVGVEDNTLLFVYSTGTKQVNLTFAEMIGGLYFEGLQEFVDDEWVSIAINDNTIKMLTNRDRRFRALYVSAGERTVTVAYADIPNVTPGTEARICGQIGIVESNYPSASSPNGITFVGERGVSFTLRATQVNGWRFVGWYYDKNHVGVPKYTGQDAIARVISNRTLYAYFEPDTHAVYEWEGRNENKMMTWRSKVYVSPRPFNPSAIRVDAEDARGRGTPVARVEIGMMSSPDAEPAAVTVLTNMPNYVARRLPHKRPERYLQVEVQNDAEIDRIIVGTSMGGIAV